MLYRNNYFNVIKADFIENSDKDAHRLDIDHFLIIEPGAEDKLRAALRKNMIQVFEVAVVPGDHSEVVLLVDCLRGDKEKVYNCVLDLAGAPDDISDLRLNDKRRLLKYSYSDFINVDQVKLENPIK